MNYTKECIDKKNWEAWTWQNCQHSGVGHISDTDTNMSSTRSRRIFFIFLFFYSIVLFWRWMLFIWIF